MRLEIGDPAIWSSIRVRIIDFTPTGGRSGLPMFQIQVIGVKTKACRWVDMQELKPVPALEWLAEQAE